MQPKTIEEKISKHHFPDRELTKEEYALIAVLDQEYKFARTEVFPDGKIFFGYNPSCKNGISFKTKEELEKVKEKARERFYSNREERNKKNSESYYKNHEYRKERNRQYRLKNKEKCYNLTKRHRCKQENKDKRNFNHRIRFQTDHDYKTKCNLRSMISNFLRPREIKKKNKTLDLLGCSVLEFKNYIEYMWSPWMNWENYGLGPGKWNYDHIIPCDFFDLVNETELRICANWRNVRPLSSSYNSGRKNTLPLEEEVVEHHNKVSAYCSKEDIKT